MSKNSLPNHRAKPTNDLSLHICMYNLFHIRVLTYFSSIIYCSISGLFHYIINTSMSVQGSNMFFHVLTFARSRGGFWKPRPKASVFNTSQGTRRTLMHWKTMFDRYYCIKTEKICYILRYFLHYFASPFHWCLANVIATDYARSRAGSTHLVTAANLWPWYDHIESCVAVH